MHSMAHLGLRRDIGNQCFLDSSYHEEGYDMVIFVIGYILIVAGFYGLLSAGKEADKNMEDES